MVYTLIADSDSKIFEPKFRYSKFYENFRDMLIYVF